MATGTRMTTSPSPPNPIDDLRQLLTYPFMVDALAAGTIVAVLAGVVGWYVVLRRQAFASHTLSVMAFPGATGAALAGLPAALGYYVACTLAALAIGRSGRSGGSSGNGRHGPSEGAQGGESAVIGTIQTVGLAAGFLFLSLNQAVLAAPRRCCSARSWASRAARSSPCCSSRWRRWPRWPPWPGRLSASVAARWPAPAACPSP